MFCLICPDISLLKIRPNVQELIIPSHFSMCPETRLFEIWSLNVYSERQIKDQQYRTK